MNKTDRSKGKKRKSASSIKKKLIMMELCLFLVLTAVAAVVIAQDYRERPGIVENRSIKAVERNVDSIVLEWKTVRNTDKYAVYYKKRGRAFTEWIREDHISDDIDVESGNDERKAKVVIGNLEEGTDYVFLIRADNEARKGIMSEGRTFSTRATQKVSVKNAFTKLTSSKDFKIGATARTRLTYTSSDPDVIAVTEHGGKAVIKGEGTATIKISAEETGNYLGARAETKITVLKSTPVRAAGAGAHIIYHLDAGNCDTVKRVAGEGSAKTPQSFGFAGDKYIIAFGSDSTQRIITYSVEGDERSVSVPKINLGHPNGFAYADSTGLGYCVRGWSGRCVTYSPQTGKYDVITLPYGASGIAYDRKNSRFYTSSRTAMISYSGDGKFKVLKKVGVVKHKGKTYTQDCGGHAGIMMRCLSGSSKHGTNYIDLYDMINGNYLGTISTALGEVESAVCDDEGYMLLLVNSETDYIWKTNINIEDIAQGLR